MPLIKFLHVALAFITVAGFVVRGLLAVADSPLRNVKWVRIAPHVIDTLLLVCGITLAVQLSLSPLSNGWLMAKIVGLLVYIGFGVITMRASSPVAAVWFCWRRCDRRLHLRGGLFQAGHAVLVR